MSDRQQGIDWTGLVENGNLSPTLPLDWWSLDAEYLEQFRRNSGWASPFLHWIWVGNGQLINLISYTILDGLTKIGWKDVTPMISEEIDHLRTEKWAQLDESPSVQGSTPQATSTPLDSVINMHGLKPTHCHQDPSRELAWLLNRIPPPSCNSCWAFGISYTSVLKLLIIFPQQITHSPLDLVY